MNKNKYKISRTITVQNLYKTNDLCEPIYNKLKDLLCFPRELTYSLFLTLLKYKEYKKSEIVFKEGDKKKLKLYIIIEGVVGVSKILKKAEINDKKPITIKDVYIGYFLRDLSKNNFFGEQALIKADNVRTASIYTITNCKFFTISKTNFDKFCKNTINKDFENKKKIFYSCFGNISNYILEFLIYSIELYRFKRNNIIIKCGDKIDGIYIVYKGFCSSYIEQKNVNAKKYLNSKEYFDYLRVNYKNNIYLKNYNEGQVFGQELFDNKDTFKYNIICDSSELIILKLKNKKFINYNDIFSYLKNNFKDVIKYNKEDINNKIKSFLINTINNFDTSPKINNSLTKKPTRNILFDKCIKDYNNSYIKKQIKIKENKYTKNTKTNLDVLNYIKSNNFLNIKINRSKNKLNYLSYNNLSTKFKNNYISIVKNIKMKS